jgi:lipid-binding SYLF domain-containing protein
MQGRGSGRLALCGVVSLLAMLGLAPGAAAQSDEADRIRESATVFEEIMKAPDKAIPNSVLRKAEGIAVFPGTIKGGFVVGAHHGRGILSVRDSQTGRWSAPAFLSVTGGSIGAQIGAQAVDIVLVIMNRRGLENLIRNEFKIGADAAVAAGPLGRDAEVSTDIQLRAEILSYSRSRGLFAGVSLKGSSIRQDAGANRNFFGKPLRTRDIVFDGKSGAPEPVPGWQATLSQYTR